MTETTAPTQMPENAMPQSKASHSKSMTTEMDQTSLKANPEDAHATTSPCKTEQVTTVESATAVSEDALTAKV